MDDTTEDLGLYRNGAGQISSYDNDAQSQFEDSYYDEDDLEDLENNEIDEDGEKGRTSQEIQRVAQQIQSMNTSALSVIPEESDENTFHENRVQSGRSPFKRIDRMIPGRAVDSPMKQSSDDAFNTFNEVLGSPGIGAASAMFTEMDSANFHYGGSDQLAAINALEQSRLRGEGLFIQNDPRFDRSHFEKENSWEPSIRNSPLRIGIPSTEAAPTTTVDEITIFDKEKPKRPTPSPLSSPLRPNKYNEMEDRRRQRQKEAILAENIKPQSLPPPAHISQNLKNTPTKKKLIGSHVTSPYRHHDSPENCSLLFSTPNSADVTQRGLRSRLQAKCEGLSMIEMKDSDVALTKPTTIIEETISHNDNGRAAEASKYNQTQASFISTDTTIDLSRVNQILKIAAKTSDHDESNNDIIEKLLGARKNREAKAMVKKDVKFYMPSEKAKAAAASREEKKRSAHNSLPPHPPRTASAESRHRIDRLSGSSQNKSKFPPHQDTNGYSERSINPPTNRIEKQHEIHDDIMRTPKRIPPLAPVNRYETRMPQTKISNMSSSKSESLRSVSLTSRTDAEKRHSNIQPNNNLTTDSRHSMTAANTTRGYTSSCSAGSTSRITLTAATNKTDEESRTHSMSSGVRTMESRPTTVVSSRPASSCTSSNEKHKTLLIRKTRLVFGYMKKDDSMTQRLLIKNISSRSLSYHAEIRSVGKGFTLERNTQMGTLSAGEDTYLIIKCCLSEAPIRVHNHLIVHTSGVKKYNYCVELFAATGEADITLITGRELQLHPRGNYVLSTTSHSNISFAVRSFGLREAFVHITVSPPDGSILPPDSSVTILPSNSFVMLKNETKEVKLCIPHLQDYQRIVSSDWRGSATSLDSAGAMSQTNEWKVFVIWGEETQRRRLQLGSKMRIFSLADTNDDLIPFTKHFLDEDPHEFKPIYPIAKDDVQLFENSLRQHKIYINPLRHRLTSVNQSYVEENGIDPNDSMDRTLIPGDTVMIDIDKTRIKRTDATRPGERRF